MEEQFFSDPANCKKKPTPRIHDKSFKILGEFIAGWPCRYSRAVTFIIIRRKELYAIERRLFHPPGYAGEIA
ncbi:MAG: hypothetical protein JSS37_02410 [Proteobacteria bacterium]|nr:hypothetical protein [Pseudomonadota bacterium]